MTSRAQTLAYLKQNPQPQDFINAARRLVFLKGNTRTIISQFGGARRL